MKNGGALAHEAIRAERRFSIFISLPELREQAYQFNAPIHIGRNCWLGAGVIVLPGITIGDNSVIGAGSVVIRDIPANVVAVGNPCKVIRKIGEHDREFYFKDHRISKEMLK